MVAVETDEGTGPWPPGGVHGRTIVARTPGLMSRRAETAGVDDLLGFMGDDSLPGLGDP